MNKLVIAGGTGLVGRVISKDLAKAGFDIWYLSTSQPTSPTNKVYHWNPAKNELPKSALEGAKVIINLSGAGIASKPWTKKRKRILLQSRTQSTGLLVKTILTNNFRPELFINASAIGYYGHRPGKEIDENTPSGSGFLSWVSAQWESETEPLAKANIPVSILRFGVILSAKGGSFPKLLTPLKLGVNAILGGGTQHISWIHIKDVSSVISALVSGKLKAGVYNVVAPNSATLKEINTTALETLKKKAIRLHIPEFVLKTVLGELSSVVLNDQHVLPRKLTEQNYNFRFPELSLAMKDLLN